MYLTVLTAIVVAVLTSLCMYNAYWVIWDFWYDNVATTTAVNTAKNILPFTRYMTVGYSFAKGSIFPETWAMNTTDDEYKIEGWYAVNRLERRRNEKIFNVSRSLDEVIDIATMNEVIAYLDLKFLAGYTQHEIFKGYTGTH